MEHSQVGTAQKSTEPYAFGSYWIAEEIGRGGMGVIHRAVHQESGQIVALKTILPQYVACKETVARFQREAQAAASLDHPHTLPIYEVGCSPDGSPFFSMELASGGSLHQLSEKYRGRWRLIVELLVKIAGAVQHAHDQGILHRDLKPGNILFSEDHEPLVSDFGLAKRFLETDDLTQTHAVLGTPNYIAPEQARGEQKLSIATDVYSLGAIFFELLTGRPPFVGDNPLSVIRQVAEQPAPPPRRLIPGIPKPLEIICLRCLERVPEYRYSSASALADDLKHWLAGIALSPRPSRWRRTERYPSLKLFQMGVSVVVAVACLGWGLLLAIHPSGVAASPVPLVVTVDDLDQGPDIYLMGDRISDELQSQLIKAGGFAVRRLAASKTDDSSGKPDPLTAAHDSGAQAVLTGVIRRLDGGVKLVVKLIRADTGEAVWRHADVIAADSSAEKFTAICEDLTRELRAAVRKTPNLLIRPSIQIPAEIYANYTKGKELATRPNQTDVNQGVALLKKAVQLAPDFTAAKMALAGCYSLQAFVWGQADKLSLAKATALEVLAQDPHCADAHRIVGCCAFKQARYQEAIQEFYEALEEKPRLAGNNFWVGACLRETGHPDRAIPWMMRAIHLDPAHGSLQGGLGETLMLSGSDDQAERAFQRGIELDPDQADTVVATAVLRLWQRRFSEARELCEQARQRFPDLRQAAAVAALVEFFDGQAEAARLNFERLRASNSYQQDWELYGAVNPTSALAYLARKRGDMALSDSLLNEALDADRALLKEYPKNSRIMHDMAATYALSENSEEAMRWLREAVTAGWVEHRSTLLDPRFDTLKDLTTFRDLLAHTFPKPLMPPPAGSMNQPHATLALRHQGKSSD